MTKTSEIDHWHAHVYFDETTVEQARALCEAADEAFADLEMGRMHEREVGPHPRWSCQLAFAPALFGEVIPWLALNREGLTIFVHPGTGDHLTDHTERTIWMGEMLDLKLEMFKG